MSSKIRNGLKVSENVSVSKLKNCIELLETDVEAASLLERVNIAENAESYQRLV